MTEKRTNAEILRELHDKAAQCMDAMLPILAAELGRPIGVVGIDLSRHKGRGTTGITVFIDGTANCGLARTYDFEPLIDMTAHALADLEQTLIDRGFAEAETSK